ncbi:hypothetical protein [Alkalimonas amylolytica]|uniref:Uncharacterized protein n=1 Tax=Alkalimonas amylolytica TaxID=152573 RepID=A0A1H4FH17_ALKAM|nr:hypothetical protein [Alkalimonas amylolytica]SEA96337.1 hypothetical protein SAMN04488051_11065 [Alkalimonas amylolytica]
MRKLNWLMAVIAVALLGACQQGQAGGERLAPEPLIEPIDPVTNPRAALKERERQMREHPDLQKMRADILSMIGQAEADDVQQCRVIGFGHKPCGGPAEYIAYSTKGVNETVLQQKIASYNKAAEAENIRLGRMSDCAIVPEPAVSLVGGQCKITGTSKQEVM